MLRLAFLAVLGANGLMAAPGAQEQVATLSAEAHAAMEARRYEEAASLYSRLRQILPKEPGIRLNLGLAYHLMGRHEEAVPELIAGLAAAPRSAIPLTVLGASLLKLGQPDRALPHLLKATDLDSGSTRAWLARADAHLALEDYGEAVKAFAQVSRIEPANAAGWYGLAESARLQAEKAVAYIGKQAPGSAYEAALEGYRLLADRQYRQAFHALRAAQALQPTLPGVSAAIAAIYQAEGHDEWARQLSASQPIAPCKSTTAACRFEQEDFLPVCSADARAPEALYWQARACGRIEEQALAELRKFPDSPEARRERAARLERAGKFAEAATQWRALYDHQPDPRWKRHLAYTLQRAGDLEPALPLLKEIAASHPEDAQAALWLGEALTEAGQAEQAVAAIERARAVAPELSGSAEALARALTRAGRASEAIEYFPQALKDDTGGSLHLEAARAARAAGEPELAAKWTERARQLMEEKQGREQRLLELEITAP